MALVVDASLAAAWFLPDEADADGALRRLARDGGFVPSLFWHEIRNILAMASRDGRIAAPKCLLHLAQLHALPIADGGTGADAAVIGLAEKHRLTAYDAAYLELALRERSVLATRDREVIAAARAEGVETISA